MNFYKHQDILTDFTDSIFKICFRTMSIGGVSSTCERCIVGKFSGYHAILKLAIESIELGIFRVHRDGTGDS